jgi:hypothetical protein
MSVPITSDERVEPPHPSWCSPEHCEANARLLRQHLSAPVVVDVAVFGEVKMVAQLFAPSDEPAETAPTSLELTFERIAGPMRAEFAAEVARYAAEHLGGER